MSVSHAIVRKDRFGLADSRWGRLALSSLTYSLFVFVAPIVSGAGWLVWALTVGSLLVFVPVYLDFCRHGVQPHARFNPESARPERALLDLGLMAALGFVIVPFNVGAATYIVYAAALAPFVLAPRRCVVIFLVLAIAVAAEMALHSSPDRVVIGAWVILLIFMVGGGNLFVGERTRQTALVRRAQEDVEELAKVAERERIARDLHDVLGHTLSVIALKSELAAKLADSDPRRAAEEIREVEHVSREALAEVRRAVEGYRGHGLSGELQRVSHALVSGGIHLETVVAQVQLSARQETILGLALREAVTNVIRHSRASFCRIELRETDEVVVLTVRDDGVGGAPREGFGLAGMRERVTGAGGVLSVDGTRGMLVTVRLPSRARAAEPLSPS